MKNFSTTFITILIFYFFQFFADNLQQTLGVGEYVEQLLDQVDLGAGADQVFHPAEARLDGETVVVSSPAVAEPVAVRYAWGAADEPNLVGPTGLPAPSFRTDDWEP